MEFFSLLLLILFLLMPSSLMSADLAVFGNQITDVWSTNLTDFAAEAASWTLTNLATPGKLYGSCQIPILAGMFIQNNYGFLNRTYSSLPSHNYLYFTFTMYVYDGQWEDYISVYFDNVPVVSNHYVCIGGSIMTKNLCDGYNMVSFNFAGVAAHSSSTLTVSVSSYAAGATTAYFGLGNINILLVNSAKTLQPTHELVVNSPCKNPFITTACSTGQYPDPSNPASCLPCNDNCAECFGPSASECYSCKLPSGFDGSSCVTCSTGCSRCSGPSSDECLLCDQGYWLYWNNTCLPKCEFPFVQTNGPVISACANPCGPNGFILWNNTCSETCPSPLIQRKEAQVNYCDYPCPSLTDFYYDENATCALFCQYPNKPNQQPFVKFCSLDLDKDTVKQVEQMAKTATAASSGVLGSVFLGSLLNSGDSSSLTTGPIAKMLQYAKYMKITFPPKLYLLFQLAKNNSTLLNTFKGLQDQVLEATYNSPLPQQFAYYTHNSSFIVNYFDSLVIIPAILFPIVMFRLVLIYIRGSSKIGFILQKILKTLQWNVFLIYFCGTYGDIMLFSSFEFRTADYQSFMSAFSFLICCSVNVLAILVLFKIFHVHLKIRSPTADNKNQQKEQFESYEMVFFAYKDFSFTQQIFLLIFLLRISMCNLIIAYLYEYPLLQVLLTSTLSLTTVLYLLIKRPLKRLIDLIQQLTGEIVILVFNICLLILAILDAAKSSNNNAREKLGDVIVIINIIIAPLLTGFVVLKIGIILFQMFQESRKPKVKSSPSTLKIIEPRNIKNSISTLKPNEPFSISIPQPKITENHPSRIQKDNFRFNRLKIHNQLSNDNGSIFQPSRHHNQNNSSYSEQHSQILNIEESIFDKSSISIDNCFAYLNTRKSSSEIPAKRKTMSPYSKQAKLLRRPVYNKNIRVARNYPN